MDSELEQALNSNRKLAETSIAKRASIAPIDIQPLQTPRLSELGGFDAKYTWVVTFPYPIKLLEQEAEKYVVKSTRPWTKEMEIPGYVLLNLIKRDDQKAYGADYIDGFFLFDFVDGVNEDALQNLLLDPEFYIAYAKEFGAAYAKAFLMGTLGGYTPIVTVDGEGIPDDIRWVDLTSAFNYPQKDNFEEYASGAKQIIRQCRRINHPSHLLQKAVYSFLFGFSEEYQRIQEFYTNNPDFLSELFSRAPFFDSERQTRLLDRLDPVKTGVDRVVDIIAGYI